MADSRRTRDYQPDSPLDLQYLNDPTYTPLDRIGGMGMGGAGNDSFYTQPITSGIEERLANIQQLGDQRRDLEDQLASLPRSGSGMNLGGFLDNLKQAGSQGLNLLGSGLDAITPSQNRINDIAMRLQNAHAIGTGQVPLYMLQQQHAANMQQAQDMMAMKRQQMATQLQQAQEQKRHNDLQLLEKAMSSPRASALLEQLGQDPNFSLAPQAAMLHKGMKDADYGSFDAYKQFIPEDVQARFISGQLPQHELNGWLDMAREDAKVNAKANAKSMVLSRAMNKDARSRTPFEAQLVEEHQNEQELNRLKRDKIVSETNENNAQADKYRKEVENGGAKQQNFGHDREALSQQMFGQPYGQISTANMAKVNDRLLNFQGQQQLNKSTAVQQAQLAVPDKLTDNEREKSASDLASIGLVDDLAKNFSEDWVGPARGRAGSFMETLGGLPGVPQLSEGEAKFRSDVTTLQNQVIKAITGAQMSEPEAQRIKSQIPNLNDPPVVFKARLKSTRNNLKRMAEERRKVLSSTGADTSALPPLTGKSKSQSAQPDQIQSVLDEVFGR